MTPMKRYEWGSPEYVDAFTTLLECYDTLEPLFSLVRSLFDGAPEDATAIDWGAGTGSLTQVLLEKSRSVYAVEPNAQMREILAANCPDARIINGTIMSTIPPCKARVAVMSHVLYHIPDHKWAAHAIHSASFLEPEGVLLIILKDSDSGCNRMLNHFGAPRFDLVREMTEACRHHKEYTFTFSYCPHHIRTRSLEETLKIARFCIADRDKDAFSRQPSETEFENDVRTHFWDADKGVGGYDVGDVYCLIRPNRNR